MEGRFILLRASFWLTVLKVFALLFVAAMIAVQIPELTYDLQGGDPVVVTSLEELRSQDIRGAVFASLEGTPSFDNAFVYQRYGLSYTYFTVEPYGLRLVARTYERVDQSWNGMNRFVGKLRPFDDQPFSYRIEEILFEEFGKEVPSDAYFLGLYDVPKLSAWQIVAIVIAGLMFAAMVYLFFFFFPRRRKSYGYSMGSGGTYPAGDSRR